VKSAWIIIGLCSAAAADTLTVGEGLCHPDVVGVTVREGPQAVRELITKFRNAGHLAGIGIGVPGIIEIETGTVRGSPNLPDWADCPVRTEIERRLGTPVILENDANSAALGEKWQGAARDYDSICMLTLGTGVGGGIVLNGKIWHGMSGMAGELGHVCVDPQGPVCGCGSRGCLEQLASATAIKRMAVEAIATGKAPELAGITGWLNTPGDKPLTLAGLRGKVVLLDFWHQY